MVECEKPRSAYMTKESGKFFPITDVHHISRVQLDSSFGGIDASTNSSQRFADRISQDGPFSGGGG
jgi:hypothetical protein